MRILEVKNLTKAYQHQGLNTHVLRGLNLNVESGEFLTLLGPSGSGKTTLLYVMSGLESYDQGEVKLFSKDLKTYSEKEKAHLRANDIGFVFQFYNLIPHLNVLENIELASVIGKKKTKSELIDLLDQVGMKDYITYYPRQLSGGQQQRVAIARALVNDPKIIFADEPTGNLDQEAGLEIIKLFKKLNKENHKTILMVTHNETLTTYATRTIRMMDGQVI